MHRLTALVAATLVAATFAVPAAAQPSADVSLLTTELEPLLPGQTAWVSTNWRGPAGATATDVRITVRSNRDVQLAYPSGRSFTSLHVDADLDAGETDRAAFALTVRENARPGTNLQLDFDVTYVVDGTPRSSSHRIRFTTAETPAVPYTLTTSEVSVVAGTVGWIHLHWLGHAPVFGFAVTSPGVEGVPVGYPEGRTDSSLWGNAELAPAERDYVALLIDATDLAPGTYDLPIAVTSSVDPTEHVLTLRVV